MNCFYGITTTCKMSCSATDIKLFGQIILLWTIHPLPSMLNVLLELNSIFSDLVSLSLCVDLCVLNATDDDCSNTMVSLT